MIDDEPLPMELIHVYTRAQALEDGILVDISALAKEAGVRYPVAVSTGIFEILAPWGVAPEPEHPGQALYGLGQSFRGRAWDLLTVLRQEIKRSRGDRVDFAPLFLMSHKWTQDKPMPMPMPVAMYALCGPGDDMEPVITVMLPTED